MEVIVKVAFFSNFLNHHQLPFCREMYDLLGDDFKFIATRSISVERLQMGYSDMSSTYPFTLNTYESPEKYEQGIRIGTDSDIVIIGSASDVFIQKRLNENKLTFRYSERIFKKGQWQVIRPRTLASLYKHHMLYRKSRLYMLCASAYTACDFALVGMYRNKTYKWGYFPEVIHYNIENLISKKQNVVPKILWAGRLLPLKHPEDSLLVADILKTNGYDFTLDIIGSGQMECYLRELIDKLDLSDRVNMLGSMIPEDVRKHMETANLYLFTSDFNEGWGAVLNESMNSGCAVVASHAIGSVPFLMKNGKNGLIYKSGDIQDLYNCTKKLLEDRKLCEQLGIEAYKTLDESWNAKVAAERFIQLAKGLLSDHSTQYDEGPCSKADVIKQREMYSRIVEK